MGKVGAHRLGFKRGLTKRKHGREERINPQNSGWIILRTVDGSSLDICGLIIHRTLWINHPQNKGQLDEHSGDGQLKKRSGKGKLLSKKIRHDHSDKISHDHSEYVV